MSSPCTYCSCCHRQQLSHAFQAAASAGTEYILTESGKIKAIQQQLEADKTAALAAEHEVRAKKQSECGSALKASSAN